MPTESFLKGRNDPYMQTVPFHFHRISVGINNCYLLCGSKTVLIDAGAPGHMKDFLAGLERTGVDPRSIALILLTHGHADHIGCLHKIQELTGAKIAVHRKDRAWVRSGQPPLPRGITVWGKVLIGLGTIFYQPKIRPCNVVSGLGDDGFSLRDFGIPGRVIHIPGHSMGSVCVLLDTGQVFSGDMAMNAWFLRPTPGLPVLAENMDLVIASWKKLMDLGARRVYPAHGKDFPIEIIHKEILKIEGRKGGE